jgi:hypothetical protein
MDPTRKFVQRHPGSSGDTLHVPGRRQAGPAATTDAAQALRPRSRSAPPGKPSKATEPAEPPQDRPALALRLLDPEGEPAALDFEVGPAGPRPDMSIRAGHAPGPRPFLNCFQPIGEVLELGAIAERIAEEQRPGGAISGSLRDERGNITLEFRYRRETQAMHAWRPGGRCSDARPEFILRLSPDGAALTSIESVHRSTPVAQLERLHGYGLVCERFYEAVRHYYLVGESKRT